MANGHGGSRSGAGRKKIATEQTQSANRDIVLSMVQPDHMKQITLTAITGAINGNAADRQWLSAYVLGNPADKLDVNVSGKLSLESIREALTT
jgi:hypothetical protein